MRRHAFEYVKLSHLGLAGILAFGACSQGPEAIDASNNAQAPPPPLMMEGVRLSYSERGKVQHVLVANQLIRSGADDNPAESKDFIEVEGGFTLYLGGDENLHQSKLTASKGTLDEASLRLVAENDVVLQNDVGDRLETEYLVWSEDSNRVYTNRAVAIYTEDGVLYGRGLESDGRFERYQILQPTGEMNLPDLH